jgi:hypothetical protein
VLNAATATLAAGVGLAVLVLILLRWSVCRLPLLDETAWADFERQFADYVAARDRAAQAPDRRDSARGRAPRNDAPGARRPD